MSSTPTPTGRWKLAWRTLKSYIIVLCSLHGLPLNWLHRTNHQLALTTQWNKLSIHAVSLSVVLELAGWWPDCQGKRCIQCAQCENKMISSTLNKWQFLLLWGPVLFFHKMFLNECRSKSILEHIYTICELYIYVLFQEEGPSSWHDWKGFTEISEALTLCTTDLPKVQDD